MRASAGNVFLKGSRASFKILMVSTNTSSSSVLVLHRSSHLSRNSLSSANDSLESSSSSPSSQTISRHHRQNVLFCIQSPESDTFNLADSRRSSMRPLLLQHLDNEDLAEAIIGRSISWQEDDLTRLHETLFNTPCQHITDTFNLADSRGGHAHVCTDWALRHAADIIEDVIERVHVHLCAIDINIDAIPMPSTPLQSCIL